MPEKITEEEFFGKHPSLKGKTKVYAGFGYDTNHIDLKSNLQENEEIYYDGLYDDTDIHETQLDKQKVKEVIENSNLHFTQKEKLIGELGLE